MSGWSDEGAGDRHGRAGTAGERPQKPLPPDWSVRPGEQRRRPQREAGVRRRRPRWGRRIGVALLVLLVLLVGLAVWVDRRLIRVDALPDYQGRPAATPGADWLIVGSDSREGLDEGRRRQLGTGQAAGRRADTMMLLHIPRGTGKPTLVSLPRDSYVPIPGRDRNKLNAAYAFGGPQLLARTVEQVSGIRIDRYMEVGFDGFATVVDAVGGVQICPKKAMRDPMAGLNVKAGCQVVASRQALAYVRTRAGGRGDLDRVERQQEFLGSLIDKTTSPGVLLNPFRGVPLLLRGTDAVAVDRAAHVHNLIRFPFALRDVSGGGGVATTVPLAGGGSVPGVGSVVRWDRERALALFEALKQDQPIPGSG